MDKTEQFIKMCDCPEIQKYRKGQKDFQVGDLIANYVLEKYSKPKLMEIIIFEQHDEIRHRQLAVWLPRQDQIQEMINVHYQKCLKILYDFSLTVSWSINSLEQLWLAFYMYEKHSKIWKGEEWLKKQ